MKPVDMISLYDPASDTGGDCWRACIASILELPAEDVPDFVNLHRSRYVAETRTWLKDRGLFVLNVHYHNNFPGHMIASGPSPRDRDLFHSVIWRGAEMVFDPHPSRSGIWGRPYEWDILLRIELFGNPEGLGRP